jgi:integrase
MKRRGSSVHQFVQRIPSDIIEKVRGLRLSVPVGDSVVPLTISPRAVDIRLSLRTKDDREARARQAEVVAFLEAIWRGVREKPQPLSHKRILALAGEIYHALVEALEDNPGTPERWVQVMQTNAHAMVGKFGRASLMIAPDDVVRRKSMDERFGPFADAILSKHRLVVDPATRSRLIDEVGRAMMEASKGLLDNAQGNYGPETRTDRFPRWEEPQTRGKAAAGSTQGTTVTGLLAAWWREASAAGLSVSTHQSYSSTVTKLVAFLGHDDARRVTPEDVVRYKDHRLSALNPKTGKTASPKTVKDSDLAALKTIFGWGVRNQLLGANPAEGITIKLGKQKRLRPKGFTDAEAAALLKAVVLHERGQETPKTFAAKRWVPWLQCYTGSRVGEMAQLRKQDLRRVGDLWVLNVTPEAGTVKGGEAREIPLHRHLVEMGFPAFVMAAPVGHLFLTPAEDGDVLGPLQGVKNRLAEFAREIVPDPHVQPTHGWRHRFKTICREVGIDPRIRDVIQGHAARTVADDYGDVSIKAMAAALTLFPRQGDTAS